GIARGPAIIDPHVTADGPTKLLQRLLERHHTGLPFRIVNSQAHEHTDAPHTFDRLGACSKRPRCRRTAEKRNECASLHATPETLLAHRNCLNRQIERVRNVRFGQKQTSEHDWIMSALPPKADIAERECHVSRKPPLCAAGVTGWSCLFAVDVRHWADRA